MPACSTGEAQERQLRRCRQQRGGSPAGSAGALARVRPAVNSSQQRRFKAQPTTQKAAQVERRQLKKRQETFIEKEHEFKPTWICSAEAEPGSTPLSSMPRAWATEKGEMIWPPFSAGLACR